VFLLPLPRAPPPAGKHAKTCVSDQFETAPLHPNSGALPSAPAVRALKVSPGTRWNLTPIRAVSRQEPKRGANRARPPTEGNEMYSIFYIIGVIVVILAVLQIIA
jgi:hypothetical protein